MVANSTHCAPAMTSLPNDYFPQIGSNKISFVKYALKIKEWYINND